MNLKANPYFDFHDDESKGESRILDLIFRDESKILQ